MGQNTRKDPRAKVLSMTVRYRSATLGEFIEHHSYDVSRGGMFIKTPSPFPAGTLLKFEVRIAEEQRVMQGVGRVVWKRDVAQPDGEPAGMGIKFIKIDEASRTVIERLLESREGGGVGAFEKSPEGMFPSGVPSSLPPPEDRTVMKPASELLDEALRKTAGDAPPPSSRVVPTEPEAIRTEEPKFPSSEPPQPADSDAPPARIPSLEALDRTQRSAVEPSPASAPLPVVSSQVPSPRAQVERSATLPSEDEGSGGRTLFLFVAVALVAGGIWILTKRSGPPELTPPAAPEAEPAAAPALPTTSAEPLLDTPEPGEPDGEEMAPPSEPAPPEVSAAPSAPPAAPPASAPVVVKKPKVVPSTPPASSAPPASETPSPEPPAPAAPPEVKSPPPPPESAPENPY